MFPFGLLASFNIQPGEVLLDVAWHLNNFNDEGLSTCSVTFQPGGGITYQANDISDYPAADNWWTSNPITNKGADYEVAFTAISIGSFDQGPAINVWTNMGSTVQWIVRVLAKDFPSTQAANGVTWAIRPAGGGAIIDSITGCSLSASN